MKNATYRLVCNTQNGLLIEDTSAYTGTKTVTNDAEYVVKQLYKDGHLSSGKSLYYIDSCEQIDRLLHADGIFKGFKYAGLNRQNILDLPDFADSRR